MQLSIQQKLEIVKQNGRSIAVSEANIRDYAAKALLKEPKLANDLEKEFNERADRWEKKTGFHSSPVIRFMHDDYQSIMAKGESIIPHILNRLKARPDDWFWALKHITNFDAAADAKANSFNSAIEAWLNWGVKKGYISK